MHENGAKICEKKRGFLKVGLEEETDSLARLSISGVTSNLLIICRRFVSMMNDTEQKTLKITH